MKILTVGRIESYDEVTSRFSQFSERSSKYSKGNRYKISNVIGNRNRFIGQKKKLRVRKSYYR